MIARLALATVLAASVAACASSGPTIPPVASVDLPRFMGDWYVIAHIPSFPEREAYNAIDWPILVMLGALIPVSDAAQSTGLTDSIAQLVSMLADFLPRWGYVAILLLIAMCVTPFLNNAATVLILAPIAVSLATSLKMNADPLLMAVAIGAGCDFLTPIGHQCNTLVMGPGGYRFGDYWRLGLPLSFIVLFVGVPLILLFWPL